MNRKLIFVLAALFGASLAYADGVWQSSHTATADTALALCTQTGGRARRGVLHGVCVNKADAGTITIYDSSSTANAALIEAVIQSTSAVQGGCKLFDIYLSSGLVYTNSAATDMTILYQCY